jgi:F5/8 type C domain
VATCEQCGSALNETDTFCGVCGSFTAWARADSRTAQDAPQGPEPPPAADDPAAVLPAVPSLERGPGRPAAAEYVAGPDDVRCPACAASNPAGRRFCRRCGTDLSRPSAPEHRGWWRRLLAWFTGRRRRHRLARRRGGWAAVRRLVALAVVAAGIGIGTYAAVHHGSTVENTVRAHFSGGAPDNPSTVTSSGNAAGHPASAAIDGDASTWWSPAAGSALGQWVQADFAAPATLLDVEVMVGASQQQNDFLLQARPAALRLTATTANGRIVVQELSLADKTGFQPFHMLIPNTVSVRLTIESVDGAEPGRLTALAEVEFFAET